MPSHFRKKGIFKQRILFFNFQSRRIHSLHNKAKKVLVKLLIMPCCFLGRPLEVLQVIVGTYKMVVLVSKLC